MIQSFGLEFDNEQEMLKTADKLWDKLGVTGEMEMFSTPNGTWRLHVHSEKQVRDTTLEKLPGKRVQPRSTAGMEKKVPQEDAEN